ncbi:MAG: acyl-CoA dehydrogenase family protein, partial [Spirochaetales bacterium]
ANSIKSVVTDFMQSAAQSALQLFGGNGYRREHIAARSLADSRPFQIFEGSNDILYEQITEIITKGMKRAKETNLFKYLRSFDATSRAAEALRNALDIDLRESLPQRRIVQLGRALGRVVSLQMLYELADRGYSSEHISNAEAFLRGQISALLHTFRVDETYAPLDQAGYSGDWLAYVD